MYDAGAMGWMAKIQFLMNQQHFCSHSLLTNGYLGIFSWE
jgi:hypothetical protein